jgi:uncharacterized protein
MTGRFVQLHLFLARHRGKVLLGFLLFAAAAVLMARKLKLNEDFTEVLPMSAPAIAEQVQALQHIQQAERLYIDVATAATNSGQLAAAADKMTAALGHIPELSGVRGKINLADMSAAYTQLQAQLPTLLGPNELRQLEPRLTPTALEKRLAWLKQAMTQPQGMMFERVAQTDPAGISDAVSARLRDLQAGAGGARIVGGYITSADGRHVLLSATPGFRSSETAKSAPVIAAVLNAARSVEQEFPPGAVKISVTGAHRSALDNATMIRSDTARTSIVATVGIAALIILACRRRWLALLALVPVLFGGLGAVTVFYLTGDRVSAVALGCGSMLIGVAVDYGIYIVYQLDDSPPPNRPKLARAVAGLAPALMFGALTTMAAFFVMFLSPVSGHRQLGLFGALGVGLAALFAIFILPVFIPLQPADGLRPLPLTALLQRVFDWRSRNTRLVLPALILFTLLCAAGVSRLKFDGDLARLNGVTAATRQDEQSVRKTWGQALSLTTIVVGGATRDDALMKNERVFAVLKTLRDQKVVESFSSVAPLMPSAQTRQANLRAWQDFWSPARQSILRDSLAAAGAKLGFRAGAFAPFLETISRAASAATTQRSPALDRLTADFWSERDGRFFVTTLVKAANTEEFQQVHTAVKAAVPGALLLNKAALAADITQVARRALPIFGFLVAGLNAVLIYLLLGRLELVLVTLLPMAAGIFWTLGTLGLLGLPVDAANFVFVIFVFGVGGDYSLFLVLSELEPLRGFPERTAATGGAVTMCALTSLLGTGVLVLAHHPALFSVGLTALLGISYSLLATLFLVPLSVRWLAQSKLRHGEIAHPAPAQTLRAVSRLYHLQGPYVSHFVYWKMKADPLFRAVEKAAPARGEILDLGCGFGMMAHWLTLFSPERRVLGLDFDARKIRAARITARANPRVNFEQCDILETAQFPACDCALLCDVLHYFPRELKKALLRKASAALRPGGWLLIRDAMAEPNSGHRAVALMERWAVWLGQNRTRHGLYFEQEQSHLALLREAGFTAVQIKRNSGLGSNVLVTAAKPCGSVP